MNTLKNTQGRKRRKNNSISNTFSVAFSS